VSLCVQSLDDVPPYRLIAALTSFRASQHVTRLQTGKHVGKLRSNNCTVAWDHHCQIRLQGCWTRQEQPGSPHASYRLLNLHGAELQLVTQLAQQPYNPVALLQDSLQS
jgi:hypothetical protein